MYRNTLFPCSQPVQADCTGTIQHIFLLFVINKTLLLTIIAGTFCHSVTLQLTN